MFPELLVGERLIRGNNQTSSVETRECCVVGGLQNLVEFYVNGPRVGRGVRRWRVCGYRRSTGVRGSQALCLATSVTCHFPFHCSHCVLRSTLVYLTRGSERDPGECAFFVLVQSGRLEEAIAPEHKVHCPLVRELEFLANDAVNWLKTLSLVAQTLTRFNSWGRNNLSLGTMGKSYLGSPTTTSVLGSRRKQACFMAVMIAVTGLSRYGTQFQHMHCKKKLTPVSTPEFLLSDQKVGSLVVVPESPNVGAVPQVRNLSPTIKTLEDLTPSDLP